MNAEKDDVQGVPNCTESDLQHQISLLLADGMTKFVGLSLRMLVALLGKLDTLQLSG